VLAEVDPAVRVRLGTDRETGKSRGFAFAEFSDATHAADAVRRFDSFELRGRRLRVNDADDKPPPRAPRPGGPRPPLLRTPEPRQLGAVEDFGMGGGDPRAFRRKGGSRRGLRAKKRSLR
jgi:RNA recognition motif-containing protein